MYAVISDRTRQFTVKQGDLIQCDLGLAKQPGDAISFEQVLLVGNEGKVKVGAPFVAGAKVRGEVVGDVKGNKLVIFKYKRRKNMRRKNGHRQGFTAVRIQAIEG